jgi:hypothetical protein
MTTSTADYIIPLSAYLMLPAIADPIASAKSGLAFPVSVLCKVGVVGVGSRPDCVSCVGFTAT